MKKVNVQKLKHGDRIYTSHDTHTFGNSAQPMTVLRVNRATVTVIDDRGNLGRVPKSSIERRAK